MGQLHQPRIHATALISPDARLADDVQIGPFVVIEGDVEIGPGSVLRSGVHLIGPLKMGANNTVYSHAILGEDPQHLQYQGESTSVEIGDNNVIREFVTIHRATKQARTTRIGNNNFLMANSHVAHDCQIGNNCILANAALVGGHCNLEDNVYLSGNTAVHQFVRVGRLALLSGCSATSKDIPPFIIQQGLNCVMGVNAIGMRRAGIPAPHIDAVRRAFQLLYREHLLVPQALLRIEAELNHIPEIRELVSFVRGSAKGINLSCGREAA